MQDELKVDYVVCLSLEERLEGDISMRSSQSFQFKPLNVEMERINQAMHSAVVFNFLSVFKYFKDINIVKWRSYLISRHLLLLPYLY